MNSLIRVKAQLQCFAKALFDQIKGNTLGEIPKLICCALLLTLALGSGPACDGFPGIPGGGTPVPGSVTEARTVQFFNCNHDPSAGPHARVYNVFTQVDGGKWVGQGGLNIQPDPWSDCHDAPHQGSSLTLDLYAIQQGKWEFRLVKLPLAGEPDCDSSSLPDSGAPNLCGALPSYFFQTVQEAPPRLIDVTSF
jgi:hypothetical protein